LRKDVWKRMRAGCISTAVLCILTAGAVSAAEFSATMKQTVSQNKQTTVTQGNIYIKGIMQRQESGAADQKMVMIARPDKGVVWHLLPSKKVYVEQQIPKQTTSPSVGSMIMKMQGAKKIGTVKISNYQCDKYQYTDKQRNITAILCISPKLNHEVKSTITTPRGKVTSELINIKEAKLPASLFELPKGYKKMALPTSSGNPSGLKAPTQAPTNKMPPAPPINRK
jgi:outer membrane lipoprotein-sorting protein